MIVVTLPLSAEERLADIFEKLKAVPVDVRLCPDAVGFRLDRIGISRLGDVPLLNVIDRPLAGWRWSVKTLEDRVLATLILLMAMPLMMVISLVIKLDSPGPVLFRQKRYGYNNQLIEVMKFRTMYDDQKDENAEKLTQRNDPRVTRIGAFLRKSSLDELPQVFNVLRGEMSIVGPRPHACRAKAGGVLYQTAVEQYESRHRVKPGITGWAQVNGWRGETETVDQIRRRVEHDLAYIENWSVALDLKIILRTLKCFTDHRAY
jgi:Undecaprenyl-phosphate glucose phosphotransferase